jgi:hypothetical protein
MSNNIYDIMKKLNAVSEQDIVPVSKQSTTLLESTMKEVLNEKYMGFDKTVAAIKKGGSAKGKKLSERVSVGAEYELDPADMPMPGNKLSPKDQYSAIMKDVEKVQSGARYPIGSMNNLRKDSDAGRFAAPGLGDQGQFFQEDDMEEGNLFTGNLAKARAAGKKRADLDGDGDMETVKEQGVAEGSDIRYHPTSGTKATYTVSSKKLSNKPQASKSDVTLKSGSMHHRGNSYNFPKGTLFTQLPGGIFAKHPSVPETHPGYGHLIRSSEDNINKIHGALNDGQDVMEEKKTTKSGTVHKAKPGRYGGYDPETDPDKDEDDKKSEPAVKRGRGRPKKGSDSDTGEVKKWDTSALQSAFGSSAPKKLPGKASVKHKMKDDDKLDEVAPPGAKAERMVKNIKKGYAKDGKLTDKEKGIAYATTWKAKKAGKVEESIPPGFPRELAKRIYEHYNGDINSTLTAMWNVHNTVMESKDSQSKKKLSEGMTFEKSTTKPNMKEYKNIKEDRTENKELSDVLKLAGIVGESVKVDECGMSPIGGAYGDTMQDTEGRMSINTNMSTDGNKTVTITADGDSAVELMKMLKMAGLSADGGEDTDIEKMSEEKDDRYEANTTPEEEVLPVQTQLKGGNGEVAGKEKKMTPHGYKFADNPLAMNESMTLKLMKEYESIKKTK